MWFVLSKNSRLYSKGYATFLNNLLTVAAKFSLSANTPERFSSYGLRQTRKTVQPRTPPDMACHLLMTTMPPA